VADHHPAWVMVAAACPALAIDSAYIDL